MTGISDHSETTQEGSRTARIETTHDDPSIVAAAIAPDNTADVETTAGSEGAVRTRIRRDTTGGLQSTVDDYVVNLTVAERVCEVTTRVGSPDRIDETTDHTTAEDTTDDSTS